MIRAPFDGQRKRDFSLGIDRLRESRIRPSTTDEGRERRNEKELISTWGWLFVAALPACSAAPRFALL
jgi:hypothetical protein